MAALLGAVIVVRRLDAVTNPQFWAEDGYVFFAENLALGFTGALTKLYFGFPYLTHRLIAFAGGLVPFEYAPRVYTTSAIALTALGLATFALPAFRHLVRSDFLRVLFGVAAVSAPFNQEVLSNPTNLGWFLAVVLSLLSLARLPTAPWRVALLSVVGAALICSTPLAPVNVPLWLLRAWRGARRSLRREAIFALVLLATLALLMAITNGLGAEPTHVRPGERITLLDYPVALLRNCAGMLAHRTAALVLPPAWLAQVETAGVAAVVGVAAMVVTTLFALCAAGRFGSFPALLAALYLFVAYFLAFVAGRPKYFVYLPAWSGLNSRYTIFPAAMLALALVAALDGLPAGRVRRLVTAAMVVVLVLAWSPSFVVKPFRDLEWSRWASALQAKRASGSREPLRIPMNPPWTPLIFDPLEIAPEPDVPADVVLVGLGTHGTFRQLFLCRCDGLAAVQIRLSAPEWSAAGEVSMSLFKGQTPVARRQIPRSEIEPSGSWQTLYVDPVSGSAGQHFTVVVQAVNNVAAAPVYVLGAVGDPYPGGTATWGRSVVAGDATFKYGCRPAQAR